MPSFFSNRVVQPSTLPSPSFSEDIGTGFSITAASLVTSFERKFITGSLPQIANACFVINPETPVIIGHLGTPTLNDITEKKDDYWTGLKVLSELDNVFMKISMLAYTDSEWEKSPLMKDTVLRVIDLFGVDRCQFASNLPVENLWGWDAKRIFSGFLGIVENQFSYEDQQKLFADNARKVYRA